MVVDGLLSNDPGEVLMGEGIATGNTAEVIAGAILEEF